MQGKQTSTNTQASAITATSTAAQHQPPMLAMGLLPPPASPAASAFEISLDASPPFCHAPCTLRVPAGSLAELKAGISAQLALDSSVQFDVLVCDEDFDEFCVRRREQSIAWFSNI